MAIELRCECGKQLRYRDEHEGRMARCPACQAMLTVSPAPFELPVGIVELEEDVPLFVKGQAPGGARWWKQPTVVTIAILVAIMLLVLGVATLSSRAPGKVDQIDIADKGARSNPSFDSVVDSSLENRPVYKAKIPAYVSWRVLGEYFVLPARHGKRTIEVMLDRKVEKEVLREIAKELKSLEKEEFEITDVRFFVSDKDRMPGAWAWSRDTRNETTVEIWGLTAEEEARLSNLPLDLPEGCEFMGCWLAEEGQANYRYVIYGLNGRHFIEFRDAHGFRITEEELNEYASATGRRFRFKNTSYAYEIDPDGTLRIYNEEGKLRQTCRAINPPLRTIAK